MKRFLPLILIVSMLIGCATTHEEFTYGGVEEDMRNGLSVYYQLELSYIEDVEGKSVIVSKPIPIDSSFIIPETTNGLAFGLYIKNSKEINYEIWEEYEVLQDKNTEPYYIKRRLNKSRLPDMVLSINLPRQKGTEVVYKVRIVSDGGVTLFSIGNAKYSVGVN